MVNNINYPKVIAKSGNRFMVEVGNGIVRVVDADERKVYPAKPIGLIIAHGSWEPCSHDPEIIDNAKSYKWIKNPDK